MKSRGCNTTDLATALRGVSDEEYGPARQGHVLEIYKMYVDMADRISARRERANAFFVTVNAAFIALLAKETVTASAIRASWSTYAIPIAGVTLCYLWKSIIRSYRDLNSAKFRVVHAMELQLPIRPYDAEWECLGRGTDKRLYRPITHMERGVPFLFMTLYAVLLLSRVPWDSVRAIWGVDG